MNGLRQRLRDYWSPIEEIDTSPRVSDEVKYTTCYMCACRCGINVHLKDGGIRYIEGNPRPPGQPRRASAARAPPASCSTTRRRGLRKPLLRVGERGSGEFREIEWDEALAIATEWLRGIRADDPKKLAFFTGRDQSPVADRLVGEAVRHAQFRRAWRLLLGQHGGGRAVHDRRQLLGIRRAGLGAHQVPADVRRRRGPRFQPDQDRPRRAEGARRQVRSRSIRCAPAIPRSPTNGSASAPAPTGCSCWRWSTSCCAPTRSISITSRATPTPPGW